MLEMNTEYLNIYFIWYPQYGGELLPFKFVKSTIQNFNSKTVFFTFDIVIQIIKCDGY